MNITIKRKKVVKKVLETIFKKDVEDIILYVKTFCEICVLMLRHIIAKGIILYLLLTVVNNKWGDAGCIIFFWFCWIILALTEITSRIIE